MQSNNRKKVSDGALKMSDDHEVSCGICLQELLPHDTIALECQHSFHPGCIVEWFRRSLSDNEDLVLDLGEARITYGMTQAQTHKILAPLIYGPRRKDANTRPLIDRYMACRRRMRDSREGWSPRRRQRRHRDYSRASQVLLTCLAFEGAFPFVVTLD